MFCHSGIIDPLSSVHTNLLIYYATKQHSEHMHNNILLKDNLKCNGKTANTEGVIKDLNKVFEVYPEQTAMSLSFHAVK